MEQYSLDGTLVEDTSTSTPPVVEAARPSVQLDLGLRQLVPTVARSVRWRGLVSQSSLDMELAASSTSEQGRPAFVGPAPGRMLSVEEREVGAPSCLHCGARLERTSLGWASIRDEETPLECGGMDHEPTDEEV